MPRVLSVLLVACVLGSLTLAQSSDTKFAVFGGYSLVTNDFTGIQADSNRHVLNGWNASVSFTNPSSRYRIDRLLSLVGDISGYYPSFTYPGISPLTVTAHSHSFLFGPQLSAPAAGITPFAQVLLGITHVGYPQASNCPQCVATSANSFALAAGGGLDVRVARRTALRFQADLFRNGFSSPDNQLQERFHELNVRISTGLVFRF